MKLLDYQHEGTAEARNAALDDIPDEIEALEFQLDKAEMLHYVRERDRLYQEKRLMIVNLEIEKEKKEIEALTLENQLEIQKKIYKQEYEMMATRIIQFEEKEALLQ